MASMHLLRVPFFLLFAAQALRFVFYFIIFFWSHFLGTDATSRPQRLNLQFFSVPFNLIFKPWKLSS